MDSDLIRAIKNPNNIVKLDTSTGTNDVNQSLISGFITEDFSYALGNKWDTLDDALPGVVDTTTKTADNVVRIGKSVAGLMGALVTQTTLKASFQTVAQYAGSEKFQFDLNLTFLALEPNDDPMVAVRMLNSLTLPNFSMGLLMEAPLQYAEADDKMGTYRTRGTIGVSIGNWFRAPPVFLVTTGRPTISRVQTRAGHPLYVQLAISFQAYRMFSQTEVNQWFPST